MFHRKLFYFKITQLTAHNDLIMTIEKLYNPFSDIGEIHIPILKRSVLLRDLIYNIFLRRIVNRQSICFGDYYYLE